MMYKKFTKPDKPVASWTRSKLKQAKLAKAKTAQAEKILMYKVQSTADLWTPDMHGWSKLAERAPNRREQLRFHNYWHRSYHLMTAEILHLKDASHDVKYPMKWPPEHATRTVNNARIKVLKPK